jgi:hypothetical protein
VLYPVLERSTFPPIGGCCDARALGRDHRVVIVALFVMAVAMFWFLERFEQLRKK